VSFTASSAVSSSLVTTPGPFVAAVGVFIDSRRLSERA
jgi:hypothetical protein